MDDAAVATEIATWLGLWPWKSTRSPGRRSAFATLVPRVNCCAAVRGMVTPAAPQDAWVSPEQSNAFGPVAP